MSTVTATNTQIAERVMTLKDVIELINTDRIASDERPLEHGKQMKKVEELAKQPSFGLLAKISTMQITGFGRKELITYHLTKKQAMAVGAKLDNKRLMMVIDKLEELSAPRPMTTAEQIALIAKGHSEMIERIQTAEDRTAKVEEKMDDIIANRKIENWQQKALTDAKNTKVYQIAERGNLLDDKAAVSKLHRKVWSMFKKQFHLPRYNELPVSRYEAGLEFINNLTLADMM